MELPLLTKDVLLDRHQAAHVAYYLGAEQAAVVYLNPDEKQRMSALETLSLAPLKKLLQKLDRLAWLDERPAPKKARPHKLKVKAAEMVVVRLYYARMLASAAADPDTALILAEALGRFHQPSLSLERHIDLPDPTRYTR